MRRLVYAVTITPEKAEELGEALGCVYRSWQSGLMKSVAVAAMIGNTTVRSVNGPMRLAASMVVCDRSHIPLIRGRARNNAKKARR